MKAQWKARNRGLKYAAVGFSMIVVAPAFWALLHTGLYYDATASFWSQLIGKITASPESILLYSYMGIGAALIASISGYILGKSGDQLRERAGELEELHEEVTSQKEMYEERYRVLDGNIMKFQHISTAIQKSLDISEVVNLCAEGLHDVLGFERVNILLADPERKNLHFLLATGSEDFDTEGVILPLDERIGVIYKCFAEQKFYSIDDIGKCPKDYYLRSPYDTLKPLRSRAFVLCPIVIKGESVGLFGIDNAFSRRLTNESDEDTIKLFADQAAAAIVRIKLLKAIDALTSELDNAFAGFLQKRDVFSQT
ncbi:MAG TPA: GAF domain-containing protein, partial [Geobacteraceae bacterium]|nr:GAF domain-containing protein [Geobacteraceae bacterium]